MGLHDDSEETRRIGIWDLPGGGEPMTCKYNWRKAGPYPHCNARPHARVNTTAQCKLAVNAIYMAYGVTCPSPKSIEDLNTHLAGCLAQDSALAVLEALDILRAGIERGEWFEES